MAEKSSELNSINTFDEDSINANSLQIREDDDELLEMKTRFSETEEETSDEAVQIREQIVETRRGMSETIDAIQEKLSFANISEQVQTQVSEQISNAVETAKDVIYDKTAEVTNAVGKGFKQIGNSDLMKKAKANPTALALIGAGIGALLVSVLTSGGKKGKKRSDSYNYDYDYQDIQTKIKYEPDISGDDDEIRYAESSRRELAAGKSKSVESGKSTLQAARNKAGDATTSAYKIVSETANSAFGGIKDAAGSTYEKVGDAASKTFEGATNIAGKTYETVGSAAGKTYQALGSAAGYTYEKAGNLGGHVKINYEHYIEENPIVVGAVAFAVGATVGFAIPLTRKENEYLGEYRDQVFEKVQSKAQETIGSVKDLATEAQKAITEEVKSKTA